MNIHSLPLYYSTLSYTPFVSSVKLESIEKAKELYSQYENFEVVDERQKIFEEGLRALASSYEDIASVYKKNLSNLEPAMKRNLSKIFFIRAGYSYGSDMETSRKFYLLSLEVMLESLSLVKNADFSYLEKFPFDQLKPYVSQLPDHSFTNLEFLKNISNTAFAYELFTKGAEQALEVAVILRKLGHTYQNLAAFLKWENPENKERFQSLYGKAEKTLAYLLTCRGDDIAFIKEVNWEMVELLYNTGPFMQSISVPQDVLGSLQTLDKVVSYLDEEGETYRQRVKRAQMFNMRGIKEWEIALREQNNELLFSAFDKVSAAAAIAADRDLPFNQFLKANFFNNKAKMAMTLKEKGYLGLSYDQIATWLDVALYVAKQQGFDHFYAWTYLINKTRLEKKRGNITEEHAYFTKAREMIEKEEYRNSFEPEDFELLEQLRLELSPLSKQ